MRIDALRQIGQIHGEGHSRHPLLEDPLSTAFGLSYRFGWDPEMLLGMQSETFLMLAAYAAGRSRGEEIRRAR